MKRLKKIVLIISNILLIAALVIVSYIRRPYVASEAMYNEINTTYYTEYSDHYQFEDPSFSSQIILVPGGLVDASAYLYLADQLYQAEYNVTIIKPPLYLAILSRGQVEKFIDDTLDTTIIGHSLGGVVAGNVASRNDVDALVLLASYITTDVDMDVLSIRGSEDLILDAKAYNNNYNHIDGATEFIIDGGNHAQFGWYGEQTGDGEATITVKQQQDIVIQKIITFLGGNNDN